MNVPAVGDGRVLQHAPAALDEVRRQEFFRAGAVMRAYGRGKRCLLLRRWKTVRGSKLRRICFMVSSADQRSTRLSHEARRATCGTDRARCASEARGHYAVY